MPGSRPGHDGWSSFRGDAKCRARNPYVDGPRATRVLSGSDRIACIHMSGLLMRSLWTAGQDGFRDASSKQPHDLSSANGFHGLSRTLDRSILPSALLLQLRLSRLANFADRPIS